MKPCPFCGAEPTLEDHRTVWAVTCSCGVSVLGQRAPEPESEMSDAYWESIKQTAIDAWNKREVTQQVAVPQGWKPIPTEPTKAMWKAAGDAVVALQNTSTMHHDKISDAVYRAMLAASPQPPQPTTAQ